MTSTSISKASDNVRNPYGANDFDWESYARSRPPFPIKAIETIIDYHSNGSNQFGLALDVACGPGTGTTPFLIDNFARVIGCDRNSQQLEVSRKRFGDGDKVVFRQSDAESLEWVEDGSVDMITCCAAIHWLDIPAFMREVARCLSPGGTFAAYIYRLVGSSGNPEIDSVLESLDANSLLSQLDTDMSPSTKTYYESFYSHYDNIPIAEESFSDETRFHWNSESWIFFRQSDSRAVDRRNTNSVGYREIHEPLSEVNSSYTRDEFRALLYSLDHYVREDCDRAVERIWEILGEGARLKQVRAAVLVLGRRK